MFHCTFHPSRVTPLIVIAIVELSYVDLVLVLSLFTEEARDLDSVLQLFNITPQVERTVSFLNQPLNAI